MVKYFLRMKKLLQKVLVFIVTLLSGTLFLFPEAKAQNYGNEWINFSNTYFKFKIAREGLYRISKTQLDALGLGSVTGNQFAVFREGQEVPVYVSTAGALGSNDFIEFYADKANGKMDTELYTLPSYQPNLDVNTISDTAYYFLTYDNGVHQRLQVVSNSIPNPAPAAAPYCWVIGRPMENIRANFANGQSHNLNLSTGYFYSSDFDFGEGYAYNFFTNNVTVNIPTPQVNTGAGVQATLSFVLAGHSLADLNHHYYAKVNNITIYDDTLVGFNMKKKNINIGPGLLSGTVTPVNYTDNANFFLLATTIKYPRTYNFSGDFTSQAAFQVPASERYLEISNFSTGGQAPRLVDKTNNKIYTGTESGGLVRFYLDPSAAQREMYLVNMASVNSPGNFQQIVFRDYSNIANQGTYVILSHKDYINASPSYLNEYKNYRSSMAGGSYATVLSDVTELYDQFGYGYDYHPMAIKKFLKYASATWTNKPAYLFIVGKGVNYTQYAAYLANPGQYSYKPVPTWGEPGTDNLFTSFNNDQKPALATGRLSAWNNNEIGAYLEKVKAYEIAIKPASIPSVATEFWKKKALHIAGSSDAALQQINLLPSLNACKAIIQDTLIGGMVTTIAKSTTDPIDQVNSAIVDSLIDRGLHNISFYGHASANGFDYNLNTPNNYNSKPKFPSFFAFGCNVAHIFTLSQLRTVSEEYINSVNGGSIVMIAGNNSGWTGTLPAYMQNLYKSFSYLNYDKTLGEQYRKNIEFLQNTYTDDFMDIHTQCLLFQGDPAINMFNPVKPDYAVEETSLSSNPTNVTTADNYFDLKVVVYNLGMASHDSVLVRVEHTRPGVTTPVFTDSLKIAHLLNSDTLFFKIPIDPNKDIGLNNYTVKIDAADKYEEVSEQNNKATLQLFIYSDNLVPVYPKEFAIVYNQDITLKASTLNAFAPSRKYKLELDTTENFNSTLKQSIDITSSGGVIKWKPNIVYKDSVVYYWRAAADTLVNGNLSWTASSFIFLENGSDGWNQSHYFQYLKNAPYYGMQLQESNRRFRFDSYTNTFKIENKVIYPWNNDYTNVRQSLNDVVFDNWGCVYTGSVHVVVIDSTSGLPWKNTAAGLYGSAPACGPSPLRQMFEFSTSTLASRNNAKNFIESVPDGNYIMIKNMIYGGPPGAVWDRKTAIEWMADTVANGSGNSLYHAIKNLGFDQIDQFTSKKVFAFFRKKGDAGFPIRQEVSPDSLAKVEYTQTFKSYPDTALMATKEVGPAKEWKSLKWRISATDNVPENDSPYVVIYGIDMLNNEVGLYSGFAKDTSLSFISAQQYPKLKLKWYSVDNITRTSAYLDYWRVLYSPVPEAALNAAAHFSFTDSLTEGQKGKLSIAIENLTPIPMDSMLVSYKLIDAGNVKHALAEKRFKKLTGNDTLIAELDFDVSAYPGKNFLFIEANPANDQPEQYHPNNLGYLNLNMDSDDLNPLLDVTFDGVHILDKDIVSAKPFIKVLLRDENKFLPLNDTALMKIQLVYPGVNQTPVDIPIDGTICKFIAADMINGKKNEAKIEYKPTLSEDGVYKLIVSGKDKVGNVAGNTPKYEVNFTVENKPSITNVLNYPNPFSTSTQFIFTMTGSEIPSQFKIQILTVTGKIVREIKRNELGNLHIGRNMTDYRWDGKDEYGQMLGNGVYLYRVITSIRGENVEQRKNATVDKYFKNGYGKLYIMR
jgi:hypothetical protein